MCYKGGDQFYNMKYFINNIFYIFYDSFVKLNILEMKDILNNINVFKV